MQRIRSAVQYLERQLRVEHPLARRELLTDGFSVFTEHLESFLNLSARGQFEMREIVRAYLQRVDHDDDIGLAVRLFPFTGGDRHQAPTLIVIDPSIAFGRPVLMGSGVRADVIVNFFNAGETIADLADEYQLQPFQIEEAVRYALAA